MFTDKTILITGGTGSLGTELVRQILQKYPSIRKLIIFSRDELKQYDMSQRWSEAKGHPVRYFIGNVRDKERLTQAFYEVDYVIHAAALKQVPTAEYNPVECIRTNVMGAMNVIDAALAANVEKVIALSTDKACSPINLYGATKLCSDKLFTSANVYRGDTRRTTFGVVRYGNVMGSRGSVIPFFLNHAKRGSVPITDPEMTRFWITLERAAEFVLQSMEVSEGGEIFVPKIPSMKITDLASAIVPGCKQHVVGIRPGEKIHETLIGEGEGRNAVEFPTHFVILKEGVHLDDVPWQGSICHDKFTYTSENNEQQLSVEKVVELVTPFMHLSH